MPPAATTDPWTEPGRSCQDVAGGARGASPRIGGVHAPGPAGVRHATDARRAAGGYAGPFRRTGGHALRRWPPRQSRPESSRRQPDRAGSDGGDGKRRGIARRPERTEGSTRTRRAASMTTGTEGSTRTTGSRRVRPPTRVTISTTAVSPMRHQDADGHAAERPEAPRKREDRFYRLAPQFVHAPLSHCRGGRERSVSSCHLLPGLASRFTEAYALRISEDRR